VLGSVALGSTLGLLLAAYLRFVGRPLVLVFVALGLVMTQVLDYLRFDWLLIFITAGFVVQNLSAQGDRFLEEIERLGEIVWVIFFAIAGAHLELPLLGQLWPMALALALARAALTWVAGRLSSRVADDPPELRRWAWSGLVSQAGLALGIAARIQAEFPGFGVAFAAMAVATVALNEMIGPVVFKLAPDRSGETATHGDTEDSSPAPAAEPAASPPATAG
jgi:Kef-type K+ transport system membrane component KefB